MCVVSYHFLFLSAFLLRHIIVIFWIQSRDIGLVYAIFYAIKKQGYQAPNGFATQPPTLIRDGKQYAIEYTYIRKTKSCV